MQVQSSQFKSLRAMQPLAHNSSPATEQTAQEPTDSFSFSDENWERKLGVMFYTPIGATIGAIAGAFVDGGGTAVAGAAIGGLAGAAFGWTAIGV